MSSAIAANSGATGASSCCGSAIMYRAPRPRRNPGMSNACPAGITLAASVSSAMNPTARDITIRTVEAVLHAFLGYRHRERVGPADGHRLVLAAGDRRPAEGGRHGADALRVEHLHRAERLPDA